MQLTSPAFEHEQVVPITYTCEGPNISPPLFWDEVPETAESLVLTVEDPDAPLKPWVHWLVFNIPVTTRRVNEGMIPEGGIEGTSEWWNAWVRRAMPAKWGASVCVYFVCGEYQAGVGPVGK
jgi:Raf kinase inhibitor-like YbhB/YbcL family protein